MKQTQTYCPELAVFVTGTSDFDDEQGTEILVYWVYLSEDEGHTDHDRSCSCKFFEYSEAYNYAYELSERFGGIDMIN